MTYAPKPFVVTESGDTESAPDVAQPIALFGVEASGEPDRISAGDFDPRTATGTGGFAWTTPIDSDAGAEFAGYAASETHIGMASITPAYAVVQVSDSELTEAAGLSVLGTSQVALVGVNVRAQAPPTDPFIATEPDHIVTKAHLDAVLEGILDRIEALENQ